MDYNTNCYRMFTKGQTDRLKAAMEHPARKPLWQHSNLVATGLADPQTQSVAEIGRMRNVQVYPNPTKGLFTVSCPADSKIDVLDVMGRIIETVNTSTGTMHMQLAGQPAGIYMIRITNESDIAVRKLQLQ